MDQSVQVSGVLVNFEEPFVLQVFFVRSVGREDHFESFIESCYSAAQAVEVEVIADVLVIHFCEELVSVQIAESLDSPSVAELFVFFAV